MATKKLRVAATRKLPDVVETRMAELFEVELNESDAPPPPAALADAARRADVLVTSLSDRVDAAVLAAAEQGACRMIANFGAGVDHIDVEAAHQRNVIVANTPGVLTEDTADMTLALILAAPRRLAEGVRLMREGGWSGWAPTAMLGRRVSGKRLGIIGMGRIGSAVARRAKAFGMQIHYHNRRRLCEDLETELGATYWESLDQMLARMDIVSVNCPHTPATYHLLSARRLKLMRPDAYLVNTARGEIVDENALTRMLAGGQLAGAALDVFEHGFQVNPRLRELPNVLLLPHMASATEESRLEMGEKVIINIKTFADGHTPPDRVLPGML